MSGKPARQYLEGVVVDPAWQQLTDSERRKFLRDTMTYYRKEARAVLKARYPDLGGRMIAKGGRKELGRRSLLSKMRRFWTFPRCARVR